MTCSLVVNSKSGNTRMVSGAIKRALQAAGVDFVHAAALSDDADADQVALEAQGACAADTVLVGFWCDKGACTPSVAALLSALHGKRVFLFGTCGFGADQSYYQQIIDRVTSNLAGDAELAGWAMCQGKMSPAVKQRYEAMLEQDPDNARFKMLLDNWVAAKDHPTKEDLDKILKPENFTGRSEQQTEEFVAEWGLAPIADGGRSIFLNETSSRASGHEVPCSTVLRKTKSTFSALLCVRNLQRAKVRTPRHIVNSHDDSKYDKRDACDLHASRFI